MVLFIALLSLYLGGYAYARITHQIVHLQNRSEGRQQVVARPGEWDHRLLDMSMGKPIVEAYAQGQKRTPEFMNVLFWPLRAIEAAWWDLNK